MELIIKSFEELTNEELYEILRVRVAVFVVEQKCPYQEPDGVDLSAYHVFFRENGHILAYLRVFASKGHTGEAVIGRVLTVKRGAGLGAKILQAGIQTAKDKSHAGQIILQAQTYARGFYEKAGFRQTSEEFLEDGIPHIWMALKL